MPCRRTRQRTGRFLYFLPRRNFWILISQELRGIASEAILIEAFEPRQNRKRGDDLSAVE